MLKNPSLLNILFVLFGIIGAFTCFPTPTALSTVIESVENGPRENQYSVSINGSFRITPPNEILEWLKNTPWQKDRSIRTPSIELLTHVQSEDDPIGTLFKWLREAEHISASGNFEEATRVLLRNMMYDRALLSFQIDTIDAIAFPIIRQLIANGQKDLALELLSSCVTASGSPIEYFRLVLRRLSEEEIDNLWGCNDPFIVLVDFSKPAYCRLTPWANRQDRESMLASFDDSHNHRGNGSLRLTLSKSLRDDLLIMGWQEPFLALTAGKAGIRTWVTMEQPQPIEFVIQVLGTIWDNKPFQWLLRVPEPSKVDDGWLCFDTKSVREDLLGSLFFQYGWARSFTMHFAAPDALEKSRLRLSGLGFDIPPGADNTFWLDQIELYIPRDSWLESAHAPSPREFGDFWLAPAPKPTTDESDPTHHDNLEALRSLGYLGAISTKHALQGVVKYDPSRSWPGVNFMVSGHAPELLLLDMEGNILHTWRCNFQDSKWPEDKLPASFMNTTFWRRAYLYPNGDVLAVLDYIVLTKMDKEGNVIWTKADKFHHNMDVSEDGTIYALYATSMGTSDIGYSDDTLIDYIVVLTPDGDEIRRVSLIKALENSSFAPVLHHLDFSHDVLHTNSIKILDGTLSDRIPAFRKGNILVCMHQPSLIAVVDTDKESVVWAQSDQWLYPHEPVLLKDGSMLLFDNHGPQWHYMNRLASRILHFDPITREVLWEYTGSREKPFHSYFCGSVAQLPNGNILISETSAGRAFEVTKNKELVWEYYNPFRGGNEGELIAVLFEIIRFPESYVATWLKR